MSTDTFAPLPNVSELSIGVNALFKAKKAAARKRAANKTDVLVTQTEPAFVNQQRHHQIIDTLRARYNTLYPNAMDAKSKSIQQLTICIHDATELIDKLVDQNNPYFKPDDINKTCSHAYAQNAELQIMKHLDQFDDLSLEMREHHLDSLGEVFAHFWTLYGASAITDTLTVDDVIAPKSLE